MADDDQKGEYEVGYRKPPKQHQFQPGVSGFKGRRKKPPEQHAEMIARVRDKVVVINGKRISKLELAFEQVFNQTIKAGKVRDLDTLMKLLEKYGAIPEWDRYAEAQAGADKVLAKIFSAFDRSGVEEDSVEAKAQRDCSVAEADLVMGCAHCGPELRKRWASPDFMALAKRSWGTKLFQMVKGVRGGSLLV